MRKFMLFLIITLLICALTSCNGRYIVDTPISTVESTDAAGDKLGIKPLASPHIIRLSTSKNVYQKKEDVVLFAQLGYINGWDDCENKDYKIVFNTPEGVFVTPTNNYTLIDYPSEKYFFDDNGETLWDGLRYKIEFTIPAQLFLEIESGKICAEIVCDATDKDEVEAYQGNVYFSSTSTEVAFSINSIDDAAILLGKPIA